MQWPESIEKKLAALPDSPGVYLMRGREGRIIYIGKARSLRRRVRSYFRTSTLRRADPKIRGLIRSILDFDILVLRSEADALLTEEKLIKEYKPRYNSLLKDDKRFPLLRVDRRAPLPRFEIVRIDKKDGADYFGPYVSGAVARAALNFVERRFGLRRCRPERPDAQTHQHCHDDLIRHCSAPCIGAVSPRDYLERVDAACAFLRGERPEFLGEIRAQMSAAARRHSFEEAAALRDLLFLLQRALKERALVRKAPALRAEEAHRGIEELAAALGLCAAPRVIECFDVSNISGTYAVASMVASVNGIPAPQRYRRFRIKTVEGSDDPRMMAEAVRRRYSRLQKEGAALPDLLVVDGGIAQLRAARAVLEDLGAHLPSVGLAKQFEELVREAHSPLRLPESSPARAVVTRLRDEAHRFAISYHRDLRARRIRESVLDEIPGLGEKTKARLLAHFGSLARLRRAPMEALGEVPGIGPTMARRIFSALARGGGGEPFDGEGR